MFAVAILIGIYSYLIFALGLLGLLYRQNIIILSIFYTVFSIYYLRKSLISSLQSPPATQAKLAKALRAGFKTLNSKYLTLMIKKNPFIVFLALIILAQSIINLIGALGPELAFDSLWYHLTLPKIYLESHSIEHIPGSLFYYSDMPKLTEMLYTASLIFNNEIFAKLMHFSFGILSVIAIYFLSKKYFSSKLSLLVCLIFYSNLVAAWESTTAYVDLVRTFFEIMALWGFLNWFESKDRKWLIESAVMLGLAVSTKLLAIGSLFIFTGLIVLTYIFQKEKRFKYIITNILVYWWLALLVVSPWFMFSLINTGNPVYPFFTDTYKITSDISLLNPLRIVREIWEIFTHSPDPISPLYIIFLPLLILLVKKMDKNLKPIVLYSIFSIIIWYFTPRTGGGRFILPYLPALSMLVVFVIREIKIREIEIFALSIVILISLSTIIYRGAANSRYLPVVLGIQTKDQFLSKNLNFSFGDFYDTDGFFKKTIKAEDKVLLYGFHNLYYVSFPFVDSSWIKKRENFNYIAVQNGEIPKRFSYWDLIYYNSKTKVKVYTLGGQMWHY